MRDHTKLRKDLESTGGSFPAACHEFVIPAEAGIQRARLDSPVSSTGQACQARNDGPEQKTIPRNLLRGSSLARLVPCEIIQNLQSSVLTPE
jgi:hypothetical protein